MNYSHFLTVPLAITVGTAVLIIFGFIYFKNRDSFVYYKAEIFTLQSNMGDALKSYSQESKGLKLRVSNKSGRWQVCKKIWKTSLGKQEYVSRWQELSQKHIKTVEEALKQKKEISLYFD